MAAFGISFPKLTLCRSITSKPDTNAGATNSPVIPSRTLSLSIKNVPSQPLLYDVLATTTTDKKKTSTVVNVLAIDAETKQMPKNLSVFNELQLDDSKKNTTPQTIALPTTLTKTTSTIPTITTNERLCINSAVSFVDEKQKKEDNPLLSMVIHSPISLKENKNSCSIVQTVSRTGACKNDSNLKDESKEKTQERRSSHTFTPPTSSLSNQSSSNDLNLVLSSISVDIPPLNYAIEKFLEQSENPIYQQTGALPMQFSIPSQGKKYFGCSLKGHWFLVIYSTDHARVSNVSTDGLNETQFVCFDNPFIYEKKPLDQVYPSDRFIFKKMKWYVSELRINRPLIYQTPSIDEQQQQRRRRKERNKRLSHSFDDLNQMFHLKHSTLDGQRKILEGKSDAITYSTSSLPNDKQRWQQQVCPQSVSHTSLDSRSSHTNEDLHYQHDATDDDNDNHHLCQSRMCIVLVFIYQCQCLSMLLAIQRTIEQSRDRNDTLIRNESVKKKLFDILNDDELENACLEDMSEEFEKMSLDYVEQRPFKHGYSFSSSDDDGVYASPPSEPYVSTTAVPLLASGSFDGILSSNSNKTTERYFGRSRLITTSLDEISSNNNASDHSWISSLQRPSWHTSPLPQWHFDDQQACLLTQTEQSCIDRPSTNTPTNDCLTKENRYIEQSLDSNHRRDSKGVGYGSINGSPPLLNDTTKVFPLMQDASSNLLMFI